MTSSVKISAWVKGRWPETDSESLCSFDLLKLYSEQQKLTFSDVLTGHQLGAVIIGSACVFKSGFVVQNESSAPVTVTKHSMLLFWWATVPGLNVQHMLVRKTWTKALHLPSIWTSHSKQVLLSLLPWLCKVCIHSPATALGSYDRY